AARRSWRTDTPRTPASTRRRSGRRASPDGSRRRSALRRPLGRADHARQSLLEQPRQLTLLAFDQLVEVELAHGGVVDALGPAQRGEAFRRQYRERRPAVLGIRL